MLIWFVAMVAIYSRDVFVYGLFVACYELILSTVCLSKEHKNHG